MGKRGPKPTPTKILQLRGSWRADERAGEPEPEPSVPTPPEWLRDHGLAEWNRVVPQLAGLRLLTELDRSHLAMYCESYGLYLSAVEDIERSGAYISTEGGIVVHPAVAVRNKAWEQAYKAAQHFGLTPSSRAGLSAPAEKSKSGKGRFFKTA